MRNLALMLWIAGCGTGKGPVEAELDCLEERDWPAVGELSTHTYAVVNPTDDLPYANATIHVFPSGQVTEECLGDCLELQSDSDGNVDITLAEGWFSYRVLGEPPTEEENRRLTTVELMAVHPPEPDGAALNALWADSMTKVFSFARGDVDPSLGRVVARGVDCDEVPIRNLRPRAFDMQGGELEPMFAYLGRRENIPAIARRGTHDSGRVFIGNLPIGEVRVELWGERDGVDERVACEVVPSVGDSTTTLRMRPLRLDKAAACESN